MYIWNPLFQDGGSQTHDALDDCYDLEQVWAMDISITSWDFYTPQWWPWWLLNHQNRLCWNKFGCIFLNYSSHVLDFTIFPIKRILTWNFTLWSWLNFSLKFNDILGVNPDAWKNVNQRDIRWISFQLSIYPNKYHNVDRNINQTCCIFNLWKWKCSQ